MMSGLTTTHEVEIEFTLDWGESFWNWRIRPIDTPDWTVQGTTNTRGGAKRAAKRAVKRDLKGKTKQPRPKVERYAI